jgi:hypothetical protein
MRWHYRSGHADLSFEEYFGRSERSDGQNSSVSGGRLSEPVDRSDAKAVEKAADNVKRGSALAGGGNQKI